MLADSLSGGTQEYGLGETVMGASGERQGSANVHNRGGLTSILFSRDGATAPGTAKWGWWPEGFLHEMTHNLGAVQWGAPHSTQPAGQSNPQFGHCWQGADVMCYVESAGASHAMQTDCAALPGAIPQTYDCGRDDYFNPAPPAGSYLATHWNTYDNVFLASCGEVAPACGGGQLWVPEPPAATNAPSVAGSARRGSTLSARTGELEQQPEELRLPVAAPVGRQLGGDRLRDRRDLRAQQRGPRPAPARRGGRHQRGRQRERGVGPDRPDRRGGRQPRGQQDLLQGQEEGRGQGQGVQEEEGLQEEVLEAKKKAKAKKGSKRR